MKPNYRRLIRDYRTLESCDHCPSAIYAVPRDEKNLLLWDARILGPENGVWEDAVFSLELDFRNVCYPQEPPKVKFIGNPIPYHPNIYQSSGKICLDLLQRMWTSTYDILTLLLAIQTLLQDPNADSPASKNAAQRYINDRDSYNEIVYKQVTSSWSQ